VSKLACNRTTKAAIDRLCEFTAEWRADLYPFEALRSILNNILLGRSMVTEAGFNNYDLEPCCFSSRKDEWKNETPFENASNFSLTF